MYASADDLRTMQALVQEAWRLVGPKDERHVESQRRLPARITHTRFLRLGRSSKKDVERSFP